MHIEFRVKDPKPSLLWLQNDPLLAESSSKSGAYDSSLTLGNVETKATSHMTRNRKWLTIATFLLYNKTLSSLTPQLLEKAQYGFVFNVILLSKNMVQMYLQPWIFYFEYLTYAQYLLIIKDVSLKVFRSKQDQTSLKRAYLKPAT